MVLPTIGTVSSRVHDERAAGQPRIYSLTQEFLLFPSLARQTGSCEAIAVEQAKAHAPAAQAKNIITMRAVWRSWFSEEIRGPKGENPEGNNVGFRIPGPWG
eukprot:351479-Chlamydomonas_euryale.AAC.9